MHASSFSLMLVLQNGRFQDEPQYLKAQANQARFTICLNKPFIVLVSELGGRNVAF